MLIEYFFLFFLFSLLYIIVKSSLENQIKIFPNQVKATPKWVIYVLKVIPIFLAILFVIFTDIKFFNIFLALALLFCMVGDITIMQKLFTGVIFFTLAQVIFILAFASQILDSIQVVSMEDYLITYSLVFLSMFLLAVIIILRLYIYLDSGEKEFEKYSKPLAVYSLLLLTLVASSIIFWLLSSKIEYIVVVVGAFFFLISDSIIAIREFHHQPKYSVIKVMGTYYIAIFLLSLAVI